MSKHIVREDLAARAIVREEARAPHQVDRTFELPTVLYGTTVGLYLGFFAVMAAGFASPGLIIPMVIFALFVVAGFGVPMVWARLAPETKSRALTMGQLRHSGIQTHTGRLSGRDAVVQMLILPALILLWGLATVTIAALV
jgi:hypothetical protein